MTLSDTLMTQDKKKSGVGDDKSAKRRLLPNAIYASLQVAITSCVLFFLYGYLLKRLGAEALGVWTLLMAATSLANISNLGLAGSLVTFVSKYQATNDNANTVSAIETTILTLALFLGAVGLILWPIVYYVLDWLIPSNRIIEARAILPYSMLAWWLGAMGGAIHSAIDGCHRSDLRSGSTLLSQPVLLIGALLLVPSFGLKGLAIAQISQYILWMVVGWLILKNQIRKLPSLPYRWSKKLFLEMWRYGVNFQLISIMLILSEPLAKGLLSHYTSLSSLAYFEMANRLIVQVKSILTSANQVITPYYAKLKMVEPTKINPLYLRNLQFVAVAGSVLFAAIIATGPIVSHLWIGHLEIQFLSFLGILVLGWFVNILAAPAYFANLGLSNLRPNVLGHFAIMLVMIVAAFFFGPFVKPYGSAIAWPVGLIVGSTIIDSGFLKHAGITRHEWLSNLRLPKLLGNLCIGVCAASCSLYFFQLKGTQAMIMGSSCVCLALALITMINRRSVTTLLQLNKSITSPDHPKL